MVTKRNSGNETDRTWCQYLGVWLAWATPLLCCLFVWGGGLGAQQLGEPGGEDTLSEGRLSEILAARTFESGDGFFQLLSILYQQQSSQPLLITGRTLLHLKKELTTLFPLADCTSIRLEKDRLELLFAKPPEVAVPNTYHLAALAGTSRLVLRVSPVGPDESGNFPTAYRFVPVEGGVTLDFSLLLTILGNRLRDAPASELLYLLDAERGISRLVLVSSETLPTARISIPASPAADGVWWFDILHDDFPNRQDIGVSRESLTLFGAEFTLPPAISPGPPASGMTEEIAWQQLRAQHRTFLDLARGVTVPGAFVYERRFSYHFEERQIAMSFAVNPLPGPGPLSLAR